MYSIKISPLQLKKPPQQEKEGVEVKTPLQSSFCYLIIGKPGSGKTFLIQELLLDKQFYFGKYDMVLFVTPPKIDRLALNTQNWTSKFDLDWIYSKISELNSKGLEKPQLLIIIDDYIDQLHKNRDNPALLNLLFNRRHLLDQRGVISIIITSQKYMLVPTVFRTTYTGLFVFKLNQEDWKQIRQDNIYNNGKTWDMIMPEIFQTQNEIRPFLYINKQTDEFFRNFDKIIIQQKQNNNEF